MARTDHHLDQRAIVFVVKLKCVRLQSSAPLFSIDEMRRPSSAPSLLWVFAPDLSPSAPTDAKYVFIALPFPFAANRSATAAWTPRALSA